MTLETEEEGVTPEVARQLQIIAGAMGGGLTMMAGLVVLSYFNAEAKIPAPQTVKFINTFTIVAMAAALSSIIASEAVWRQLLRKPGRAAGQRAQSAFIVRLALREGAGLAGLTVAYVAALNGVLRVYPAYWVTFAPFALFLGFLATHWPSAEKLDAEVREAVGQNPSFSEK
jgi:hypothetical protein